MLAIYSVPGAVRTDSVNFIPFAAGAAGFLWLLVTDNVDRVRRFRRRVTGDGRGVGPWEPSPPAAPGRPRAAGGGRFPGGTPAAGARPAGGRLERVGQGCV